MKLTAFTDYGLRVLIYLAAEPDRRAAAAEIARAFDISLNHLAKVVRFLGQQGWVRTVRGKGGGLELGQPAEHIVVGAVVRRSEGEAQPAECFTDPGRCALTRICRLRGVLRRATQAFYAVLDDATLADLTHNGRALAQALQIDVAPSVGRSARHV